MRRGVQVAFVVALAVIGTGWGAAAQPPVPAQVRPVRVSSHGQVILFRGLIDVFSQGMDELGEKLRLRGIASTVINHSAYDTLAAQTIANYRAGNHGPIVIAGHSLGADAAMRMAEILNDAKVPVALVVGFGPTLHLKAPANVAQVVNFYQQHSAWSGVFSPGPGFRGSLTNINLDDASDVTHFNIEKNARLHEQTIARIVAIMGSRHAPASPKVRSHGSTVAVPGAEEMKAN